MYPNLFNHLWRHSLRLNLVYFKLILSTKKNQNKLFNYQHQLVTKMKINLSRKSNLQRKTNLQRLQ